MSNFVASVPNCPTSTYSRMLSKLSQNERLVYILCQVPDGMSFTDLVTHTRMSAKMTQHAILRLMHKSLLTVKGYECPTLYNVKSLVTNERKHFGAYVGWTSAVSTQSRGHTDTSFTVTDKLVIECRNARAYGNNPKLLLAALKRIVAAQ